MHPNTHNLNARSTYHKRTTGWEMFKSVSSMNHMVHTGKRRALLRKQLQYASKSGMAEIFTGPNTSDTKTKFSKYNAALSRRCWFSSGMGAFAANNWLQMRPFYWSTAILTSDQARGLPPTIEPWLDIHGSCQNYPLMDYTMWLCKFVNVYTYMKVTYSTCFDDVLFYWCHINGQVMARLHMRFFMRFRCDFANKTCHSLPRAGL